MNWPRRLVGLDPAQLSACRVTQASCEERPAQACRTPSEPRPWGQFVARAAVLDELIRRWPRPNLTQLHGKNDRCLHGIFRGLHTGLASRLSCIPRHLFGDLHGGASALVLAEAVCLSTPGPLHSL